MRSQLETVLVVTPEQVERLRQIRNATAWGFSNDNSQISEPAQRAWWGLMHERVQAWLYYRHSASLRLAECVGYGLLRQADDGLWWNSLAVLPEYQGLGYGSIITSDLLHHHGGVVYASVRQDNPAAIAMHHVDQWERIEGAEPDRLIYFRSKQ